MSDSPGPQGTPRHQVRPAPRGPAWWPFVVALALIGSLIGAIVLSNAGKDASEPGRVGSSTATPRPSVSSTP